jgi:hypothetical protein
MKINPIMKTIKELLRIRMKRVRIDIKTIKSKKIMNVNKYKKAATSGKWENKTKTCLTSKSLWI